MNKDVGYNRKGNSWNDDSVRNNVRDFAWGDIIAF